MEQSWQKGLRNYQHRSHNPPEYWRH
jgi:hypothetical protein